MFVLFSLAVLSVLLNLLSFIHHYTIFLHLFVIVHTFYAVFSIYKIWKPKYFLSHIQSHGFTMLQLSCPSEFSHASHISSHIWTFILLWWDLNYCWANLDFLLLTKLYFRFTQCFIYQLHISFDLFHFWAVHKQLQKINHLFWGWIYVFFPLNNLWKLIKAISSSIKLLHRFQVIPLSQLWTDQEFSYI